MIVTSYFANHRALNKAGYKIWSVARYTPIQIPDRLPIFAPSADLLQDYKDGKVSTEEYTERYLKQLNDLDEFKILCNLGKLKTHKAALCCFEGKDSFCHRHILADWLNKRYNLEIKEF